MPTTNICPTASRTANRSISSVVFSPTFSSSADAPSGIRDDSPPHPTSAISEIKSAQRTPRTGRYERRVGVLGFRFLPQGLSIRVQFTAESSRGLGYPFNVIELYYESGTLIASGGKPPEPFVWDKRTEQWRAPAGAYREIVLALRDSETPYKDHAARFEKLSLES